MGHTASALGSFGYCPKEKVNITTDANLTELDDHQNYNINKNHNTYILSVQYKRSPLSALATIYCLYKNTFLHNILMLTP